MSAYPHSSADKVCHSVWLAAAAHAAHILRFGFSFRAYRRIYHFSGLTDPFALQEAVHRVLIGVAEDRSANGLPAAALKHCVLRHAANLAADYLDHAVSDLTPFGVFSSDEGGLAVRACA